MLKYLWLLVVPGLLFADTGSISGVVCDTSGNPLIGATVMILGTSYGAMTDGNGGYLIENLEPGSYTLQASMVGMGRSTSPDLVVRSGRTTVYNFEGGRPHVAAQQFDSYSGRILVQDTSSTVTDLPLLHTSASISVSGNIQQGVVRQVYANPFDVPLETVYVFPLPDDGSVSSMNVYAGNQLIQGRVYEDAEAEAIYDEAIEQGRTAALLAQERPNVFTQQLGNILPSDTITVEISYVAPVKRYEGEFEIVFPMVVPPKYIPGEPTAAGERGWSNPTAQVPDADRINPSVFPEGMRSGYDIDLTVTVDAGIPLRDIVSVNHEIFSEDNDGTVTVKIVGDDLIPNRDFVLRYTLESQNWEAGLLANNGSNGGHFTLVLQPEADLSVENPAPREYFFVVDCSGSMSGQPMAVAKETMRNFIRNMTPDDSFQIIKFSNTSSSFSEAPISATRRNMNLGLAYVELMSGTGGTEMLSGVRAALGYPEDPEKPRYVIFLTDGHIGNEAQVLSEVRSIRNSHTLLWSVGVGSSPNRYLLDGLAEEGGSSAFYVGLQEDPGQVAERINAQVTGNFISDVEIDWGNSVAVEDVFPEELPMLLPARPLFVTGRYQGGGRATIRISGMLGADPWHQTVRAEFPFHTEDHREIALMWARNKIHQLERYLLDIADDEEAASLENEIISTSLTYQILSNYTSFVAVSREVRVDEQGNSVTVEIPVNMPEGQSYEGTFGSSTGGLAPVAVGNTVITTCDMRGMTTSSISVVHRDEGQSATSTFVNQERDITRTTASGSTISILSIASSSGVDDSTKAELVQKILNAAEEALHNQSSTVEGMVILSINLNCNSGETEATVTRSFIEANGFEEHLLEQLNQLSLPAACAGDIRIEVSIEFAN